MDEIQTQCPICQGAVGRTKTMFNPENHTLICENEYYIHYINANGDNRLTKLPEPSVTNTRFQ